MTPLRLALPLFLLVCLALPAVADAKEVQPPNLRPEALDLLPFSNLERQAFNKKHGVLVYRMNALRTKLGSLRKQHAALAGKKDKAQQRAKAAADIRRLAPQVSALMARVTQEVRASGVDGMMIAYMNHAPKGPGRMERYSQGLVLLLDDLTPVQSAMFHRVVTQIEGAYLAMASQRERTMLALKQSEMDADKLRAFGRTFDRQMRLIDKRFWQLVDVTLDRDQKVWVWNQLPQRMRRKGQAQEHLYNLPGLTGSQGTRLRSLATEIEHEASPDNALVRRVAQDLRKGGRSLSADKRRALTKERTDAYRRLGALNAFRVTETRKILSEDQWLAYQSIPPRLSVNDRNANYRRDLRGWTPNAAQKLKIGALQKDLRKAAVAARKEMALARREGADYGPDSPQMMAMQMAMNGAKAGQAEASRALMGAIFTEVMAPDEVSAWVLGRWGYKQ